MSPRVGKKKIISFCFKIKYVVSDSKSAILNYTRGRILPEASAIRKSGFRSDARTGKIYLIWAPAHSGLAGNECAHDAARGFTHRAGIDPNTIFAHSLRLSGRDRLVSGTLQIITDWDGPAFPPLTHHSIRGNPWYGDYFKRIRIQTRLRIATATQRNFQINATNVTTGQT